jgi:hypothetical protein
LVFGESSSCFIVMFIYYKLYKTRILIIKNNYFRSKSNKLKNIAILICLCVFFINTYSQSQNSNQEIYKKSAGCLPPSAVSELDINNVRATIYNNGMLWRNPDDDYAGYEVPKESLKHSIKSGGIIIGGIDNGGNLRLSSKMYGGQWGGDDFFPGPIKAYGENLGSTTPEVCNMYDNLYKIEREKVREFAEWFTADQKTRFESFSEYEVPEFLYEWPALGPEIDGFEYYLAPFFDFNGDELYDPDDGDYPDYDLYYTGQPIATRSSKKSRLYGDQTLWWVMNDKGNIHSHTDQGLAMGLEIRAQAFAFNSDNQVNNMTFYNYQIINRSTYTINDTYFGVFIEGQLGNPSNNYLGCDVSRGLGYFYNRTRDDGSSDFEYGKHPPAIGLDFLGGPYQDPDESDYGASGLPGGCDESIMGVNFNDGTEDNERLGLSYFMRVGYSYWNDHTWWPYRAQEYYNYLRGFWNDGYTLSYGSTGHESDPGRPLNAEVIPCRYMFPENSDPCFYNTNGVEVDYWSDRSSLNEQMDEYYPDRNFMASSGPFTLEPGAANDVSFGLIWARSYTGFNYSSRREMLIADDVAQTLFENNFQKLDGPNAPELQIVELEKSLLIHIWNSDKSNNYMEQYNQIDPTIMPTEELVDDLEKAIESHDPYKILQAEKAIRDYKSYVFQGYKIYQVKDQSVSVDDLDNPEVAQLLFQCDYKDKVSTIVNYEWDSEYEFYDPVIKVEGNNVGIEHSILVEDDLFNEDVYGLINNYEYYYIAVAYAHNDYLHINQLDPYNTLYGQKRPYMQSSKAARGPVKVYKAIPHNPSINDGGTAPRAKYGDGVEITQHDGHGNGTNWLELKQETIDQIMSGFPWRADSLQFENNQGPIQVKIVDPLNVYGGDFIVKLEPDSVNKIFNHYNRSFVSNEVYYGLILDTKWKLLKSSPGLNLYKDTVHSDGWFRYPNEQLFINEGFSITINQTDFPGVRDNKFYEIQTRNLGYLGSIVEYEDEYVRWLDFLADKDGNYPENWIRCGEIPVNLNRYYGDYRGLDNDEIFEGVIDGKWAPYFLTSKHTDGPMFAQSQAYLQDLKTHRLSSVDIVFTADTTKWTRSAVIELSEFSSLAEGMAEKFSLRAASSINKQGEEDGTGTGMGWFPGYAIDVETGVRLNIVYGEASELANRQGLDCNSDDMMWNPTSDLYHLESGSAPVFGGKHYIYIFGHNEVLESTALHFYDSCRQIHSEFMEGNNASKMQMLMNAMWVSIPLVDERYAFDNPLDMPEEEIKIKIRIANPYFKDVGALEEYAPNNNYPMYSFNTNNIVVEKNVVEVAKDGLDLINVVPNPYYGYSEYESNQVDNFVRFTNLPQKCIISIYQTNGTLIRKLEKDNENPYLEWDLKNQSQITISGGIYIIHVNAPNIGEKVIKWFGAMRPIDLVGY